MNWGKAFNLLFYFKPFTKIWWQLTAIILGRSLERILRVLISSFYKDIKEIKCACAELWILLSLLVKICILIQKSSAEFWSWMNWSCNFWSYFLGEWMVGFLFLYLSMIYDILSAIFKQYISEYVNDWVGFNRILFIKGQITSLKVQLLATWSL